VAQQQSAQDALPAPAQSAPSGDTKAADDTLDSILAALEANVADYSHSVPSFLCKEHVVSEMEPVSNAFGFLRTVTDSIFRVRRTIDSDGQGHLDESRVVTAVDGRPPPASVTEETAELNPLNAPMSVFGIFSGGLNLVSTFGKACFRYKLHPARKGHPGDKIVIDFESLPVRERDSVCPYTEKISGRAFIQPSAMRVVRMEAKMLDHEMRPGLKETWDWTIDYAPVMLGGKSFWMPTDIHSKAVPNSGADTAPSSGGGTGRRGGGTTINPGQMPLPTYTLEAKYSDYHRLTVVSRIVPATGGDDTSAPEPGPAPPPDPQ
jgi:hypothetical protein